MCKTLFCCFLLIINVTVISVDLRATTSPKLVNQHQEVKKATNAIYIQYLGISDKPIFPIALSCSKPTTTELEDIFGKDYFEQPLFFAIEEKDLNNLSLEIKKILIVSPPSIERERYGSFKIIVTKTGERIEKSIFLHDTALIISVIKNFSKCKYENLYSHMNGLQKRFKL